MNLVIETNEVIKDLETSAYSQQVTIDSEVEDKDIMFVPLHYHQLLTNLVSNAINYNHPGGKVEIEVKVVNNNLNISVEDTGVGISPENQQRVFERFYRVDSGRSKKTGGTGLGLAIVKHIVKYHQGNIDLVSKEGVGSQFTICLPLKHNV
jgi:two-component system phosphate regulon sensor histidine kinase PhoR